MMDKLSKADVLMKLAVDLETDAQTVRGAIVGQDMRLAARYVREHAEALERLRALLVTFDEVASRWYAADVVRFPEAEAARVFLREVEVAS